MNSFFLWSCEAPMVNTIKMVYIRVNVDLNCGVPLTNSPKTGDLFTLRAPR